MIKNVTAKVKHIKSGKILVFLNNRKVITKYNRQVKKESNFTRDAASIIIEIRNKVDNILVQITLQLSNNKP